LDSKSRKTDAIARTNYLFELNNRWTSTARVPQEHRALHQSRCTPNAAFSCDAAKEQVVIRALKEISPGDRRVHYDYGTRDLQAI